MGIKIHRTTCPHCKQSLVVRVRTTTYAEITVQTEAEFMPQHSESVRDDWPHA